MTLESSYRTRAQHIDTVLTLVEHAWKMQSDRALTDLLDFILVRDDYAEFLALSDDEVEQRLREHLQTIMKRSRDVT